MTSNEWKKCKLGDIAKIQGGYPFKSSDFTNTGNIVLKIKNVQKGKINLEDCGFVNNNIAASAKDYLLGNEDILICMTGSSPNAPASVVGRVALFKKKQYGICLINQRIGRFVINEKIANKRFVYYLFSQEKTLQWLVKNSSGSANQANISNKTIENYEFNIPPLDIQQKIAKVLSAIDDKIELNNSINNNLEQQAQAIFKSWFVDFEPFGGTMPNDWKYVELGKLGLDISDGNYSSKYPKTNEFVSKGVAFIRGTDFIGTFISQNNMYYITEEKHNQLLKGHTKKDDILITTRGDIGRIAFVPNSLINKNINSQLVRINGANIFPKSYLACSLLSKDVQNDFKSLITGSALQQLPVGRLKKILLLKPNKDILNKFDYICKPLFNMSFVNYEENNRLVNLRDTLLPKLMSGEIDVSKVEIDNILENQSADKLLFSEEK